MADIPRLNPSMPFEAACEAVVSYLKSTIPLGYWAVTRYDGTDQLYLAVQDDAYGRSAGDSHRWSDSMCQFSVAGEAPEIAPDAMSVPQYASAGVAGMVPIGAYVGVPIRRTDGAPFGTICGLDPRIQSEELSRHEGLLHLLATLLSTVLEADLARTEAARLLERAELLAETDAMTGLYNRRGWERYLSFEDSRIRRYGDPVQVVVLDLDHLKLVNDTRGHEAGDEYICAAARSISRSIRAADVAARLGGDEFGIVARCTPAQAGVMVSRLRAELEQEGVGASIGWESYTYLSGLRGAWTAADAAMYEDKRRRRSSAATA